MSQSKRSDEYGPVVLGSTQPGRVALIEQFNPEGWVDAESGDIISLGDFR